MGSRNVEVKVAKLVKQVFGEFGPSFPCPLGKSEAGLGADGVQRRYLWTDAFGVFALVALNTPQSLSAARSLVSATAECLGIPRAPGYPMRRRNTGEPGFIGLRIGKEHENLDGTSDPGMSLDGMYWHYIDKWIFALLRLGQATDEVDLVERAAKLAKEVFPFFFSSEEEGMHWKLTSDLHTIPGLLPGVNDDCLSALVVFHCVDAELERRNLPTRLSSEIAALQRVVVRHNLTVSSTPDSLGWGLKFWKLQWLYDKRSEDFLIHDASVALSPIRSDLPFRLYGGMIGAKLSGHVVLVEYAQKSLWGYLAEMDERENVDTSDFFSIDKAMYATALAPVCLERRSWEKCLAMD